jgi:hypothetical protein
VSDWSSSNAYSMRSSNGPHKDIEIVVVRQQLAVLQATGEARAFPPVNYL